MRPTWLVTAIGLWVTACSVATPFQVQQRPLGLPGMPIAPGLFPGTVLPQAVARPTAVVPGTAAPAATVTAPQSAVQQPVTQPPVVQQPVAQTPVVQTPVVQQPAAQSPVVQQSVAQPQAAQPVQPTVAQEAPKVVLSLVPKGTPTVVAPTGVEAPAGIPNISKATLLVMSDKTLVAAIPGGDKLTARLREGQNRVSFSVQPAAGGTIAGIISMQVGEPYTGAFVIIDTGGRVFTVRQEYTKS